MEKKEFFNILSNQAEKVEINLSDDQKEKFYRYMELLLEWNEKINLTAIVDPKEIILKHFIDSIIISFHIKQGDSILDIGTGAGFPGIPLRIISDKSKFTLMDSLNKRIIFLDEVCKDLNLDVKCVHARAEEAANLKEYREQYDMVTSRAVARLNTLLEYMMPFAKIGGTCICMKGSNIEEELKEAENAINLLGGKLEKIEKFILPDSDIVRKK